jgi:ribose transport system substrate-binding protein
MLKKIIVFLAALSLMTSAAVSQDRPAYKIAVIPKNKSTNFWLALREGAMRAAKERGVEIFYDAPENEFDFIKQGQMVETFTDRKVDAILLAPADESGLVRPVKNAVAKNVKMVIIDSYLKYEDYVSFVATDNYKAGYACGKKMAGLLAGKGKVLVVPYLDNSPNTLRREQGFMSGLKESGPLINIVSFDQYSGSARRMDPGMAKNLIARFGFADGIFCSHEQTSTAILDALRQTGKAGKIRLIGFDLNSELMDGFNKGAVDALALQDPYAMGYKGVNAAVDGLNKNKVSPRIDTDALLLTKENVKEPRIQELMKHYLVKQ